MNQFTEDIIQQDEAPHRTHNSYDLKISWIRRYRPFILKAITILILIFIGWWISKNFDAFVNIFIKVGWLRLIIMGILFQISIFSSVLTFTILIRGMGYSYGFIDSYHALNLAQVAAAIPGKVWGFAGLAGLLVSRKISKPDAALIIFLNMILSLSACVILGLVGLIPIIGWELSLVCLVPMLVIIPGRPLLEKLRSHFFKDSTHLPSISDMIKILLAALVTWTIVAGVFTWLVYITHGDWPTSPWLIASSWPAGYVGGFVSLFTPSGLGVSEGIVTLILGPSMGRDSAMGVAVAFRIIHTLVLWINVIVSLILIQNKKKETSGFLKG
jgi:hypothetical protein